MARARRQPKRILNCIPSRERDEDWRIDTAEDAGRRRRGATHPAEEGPSADLVADQRPGNDRVVRRLGLAPTECCAGTSSRRTGSPTNELLSPRFQWMAAKETDQFNTRPTTFVEAEGTSLKAALDVSRKFGTVRDSVLPFATGVLFPGNAKHLLRGRGAAEDQHVLQPRSRARRTGVSGSPPRGRSSRGWTSTPPGTGRRRPRASSRSTGHRPSTAATASPSSGTRRRRSSSGTAGVRAGVTRASRTRRSRTRRTRSPRRTASSCSADHNTPGEGT